MKHILSVLLVLLLLSCSKENSTVNNNNDTFSSELAQLQAYFNIPGMAAVIEQDGQIVYENYLGFADIETKTLVDSTTLFPVASLTKIFSGLLAMKLEEQGKLSLEDSLSKYIGGQQVGDSVQLKHVISHTSQGAVGEHFYYSTRFGALTPVLEKAGKKSLAELFKAELFSPMKLQNTFFLKDSATVALFKERLASPYMLDNGVEKGRLEYGFSTSAGLVSDTRDLLKLSKFLKPNTLLKEANLIKMITPFKEGLPYGHGVFNQKVYGVDAIWGYGQYDCYSSLFVKIPSKNTTLILLANNNLMSDPARLMYGNLTSSLFALSFLKNYIIDAPEMALFHEPNTINFDKHREVTRDLVLAQALAESFMARYDSSKIQSSAALLKRVFEKYPNYTEYADLGLLHNLSFLKDVAFYRNLGPFNDFDTHIEAIGKTLLEKDPNNPYVRTYLGTFYDRKGDLSKASHHFKNVANAKNFSRHWYTEEAENWLRQ